MKTLLLIRHAKSSWDNILLPDLQRPLNKRGKKDAKTMAKLFAKRHGDVDIIYCSNAVRAEATALEFLSKLHCNIEIHPSLYHASAFAMLDFIRQIPDTHNKVAIIGHQPGLQELVELLTNKPFAFEKFPTTGIAELDFECDSWQQVNEGSGVLTHFDYPKLHASP